MEAYIEEAVRATALSDLPVQRKRDLIYTLFDMETYGDCGFTNLRTIEEMIECNYSFVFDKTEMYDYKENKSFYDQEIEEGPTGNGDVYRYLSENNPEYNGKVCIDSGSEAWEEMVKIGAIQGNGAKPVQLLSPLEVIKQSLELIEEMDSYIKEGAMITAVFTGAIDEMSDTEFAEIMGMTREEFENFVD